MSDKNLMDVIGEMLEEGYNDHINKITQDNIKDGKNFNPDGPSASTQGVEGTTTGQALDAGGDKDVGGSKGDNASDASADTQGVLGTESGQALDAGGDTDVGGSKGDNASDASADTQGVEGKKSGQALDAGGDKDVGKLKEEAEEKDEEDEAEEKDEAEDSKEKEDDKEDSKEKEETKESVEVEEEALEEKDSNHFEKDNRGDDSSKVLGKKTGQALDAGGDKDVGKLKEATDKGDMDGDGKDEPDDKEYMDNKDAAIKKAMAKEEVEVVAEDDVPGSDEATYKPKAAKTGEEQGVLGKKSGQALDAGGDKDVGKLKEEADSLEEEFTFEDILELAEMAFEEDTLDEEAQSDLFDILDVVEEQLFAESEETLVEADVQAMRDRFKRISGIDDVSDKEANVAVGQAMQKYRNDKSRKEYQAKQSSTGGRGTDKGEPAPKYSRSKDDNETRQKIHNVAKKMGVHHVAKTHVTGHSGKVDTMSPAKDDRAPGNRLKSSKSDYKSGAVTKGDVSSYKPNNGTHDTSPSQMKRHVGQGKTDTDPKGPTDTMKAKAATVRAAGSSSDTRWKKVAKEEIEISADMEITEEYKHKAEVIFEAAVGEKVNMIREELEAENEKVLAEEKARLNDLVTEALAEAVNEWIQENALEIKYSLRTEISENFIRGLKDLFSESYIEIPEEEVSVVDELSEAVEEQREEIAALNEELAEAKSFILEARKADIVNSLCEDLTQVQAVRLEKLAEGLEAADIEEFRSKVESLKEGYFDPSSEQPLFGSLTEEVLTGDEYVTEDTESSVAQYAAFLGRTVLK